MTDREVLAAIRTRLDAGFQDPNDDGSLIALANIMSAVLDDVEEMLNEAGFPSTLAAQQDEAEVLLSMLLNSMAKT